MEIRHQTHIERLDHRVDGVELKLAKDYIEKSDLQIMMERLEDRMERVDNKLDRILLGYDRDAHG